MMQDVSSPISGRKEILGGGGFPLNFVVLYLNLGGQHPYKAKYVRLDTETDPMDIMKLFTKIWDMAPPRLIITIHGSVVDFE